MAQGSGLKKRSDKFATISNKGKSKAPKRNKPLGPRKGGHYIAPKKAKRILQDKKKKEATKQIVLGIEKEIHSQALSGGNEFRVLQNTPSTSTDTTSKTTKHKIDKMSLGLLGQYDSSSSDDSLSPVTHQTSSTDTPGRDTNKSLTKQDTTQTTNEQLQESVPSKLVTHEHLQAGTDKPYDPFGFSTQTVESDSSSCESDHHEAESSTSPSPTNRLPLPDALDADTGDNLRGRERISSSVFSNPYKVAEEERLSVLRHHVKEFAPEVKEKRDVRRRKRKKYPTASSGNSSTQHASHLVPKQRRHGDGATRFISSDTLFDDNDCSRGGTEARKRRAGVGDTLVPSKRFMKDYSKISAKERPWTAQ